VLPLDPSRALKGWQSAFAKLDPCEPRRMPMARWQCLYDASAWFLDTFGDQAARDGWGTGDLFGLRHGFPGNGGLIERLGDNRGLVMADGRARWRSRGVPMQFNRGGGDGLPAFWEMVE
jgi:hypothetical protein